MQENQNVRMYDPKVYPRKLWVATSLEGLNDKFIFTTMDDPSVEQVGEYEDLVKITKDGNSNMTTGPVIEKDSNLLGVLVVIHDAEEITTKTFAHEAVHVADYFYQELGMYTQEFRHTNEAYAYLVGWAAGCIDDAINTPIDNVMKETEESNKVWCGIHDSMIADNEHLHGVLNLVDCESLAHSAYVDDNTIKEQYD